MKEKFYSTLREHFVKLETRLNQLDAVIGDGDHGTTLLKGLTAISNSKLPPAKAFRAETGGASGSLFSILVGAIDEAIDNSSNFGQILSDAAGNAAAEVTSSQFTICGNYFTQHIPLHIPRRSLNKPKPIPDYLPD